MLALVLSIDKSDDQTMTSLGRVVFEIATTVVIDVHVVGFE
jgi:hypothetical protein